MYSYIELWVCTRGWELVIWVEYTKHTLFIFDARCSLGPGRVHGDGLADTLSGVCKSSFESM